MQRKQLYRTAAQGTGRHDNADQAGEDQSSRLSRDVVAAVLPLSAQRQQDTHHGLLVLVQHLSHTQFAALAPVYTWNIALTLSHTENKQLTPVTVYSINTCHTHSSQH